MNDKNCKDKIQDYLDNNRVTDAWEAIGIIASHIDNLSHPAPESKEKVYWYGGLEGRPKKHIATFEQEANVDEKQEVESNIIANTLSWAPRVKHVSYKTLQYIGQWLYDEGYRKQSLGVEYSNTPPNYNNANFMSMAEEVDPPSLVAIDEEEIFSIVRANNNTFVTDTDCRYIAKFIVKYLKERK